MMRSVVGVGIGIMRESITGIPTGLDEPNQDKGGAWQMECAPADS